MDKYSILHHVDHTMIRPDASWEDIRKACDDAERFKCASVVVPNCYVRRVAAYTNGLLKIDTLAGFPYGYNSTGTKVYEAASAIRDGADEIDMVVNVSQVKNERWDYISDELRQMREICGGKVLKVIIETCLLTDGEKIRLCEIVSEAGADYIKTSTGFSGPGANEHDVELMVSHVTGGTKVKAAGGIKTFEEAERYLALGAERIGASRLCALIKNEQAEGDY